MFAIQLDAILCIELKKGLLLKMFGNSIFKKNGQSAFVASVKKSYGSTDTLRGIAILAVMLNHYLNTYFSKSHLFAGFATSIVAIFFLLSGYGLYASCSRRMRQSSHFLIFLRQFYIERAVKIFPLFFMALIVHSMVAGKTYTLWTYLGLRADDHFWFISAIIHCYIVAPFLVYWFQKTRRPLRFICLAACGVLVINAAIAILDGLLIPNVFLTLFKWKIVYRGYAFMHVLLFCAGMFLYETQAGKKIRCLEAILCKSSLLLTAVLMILFLLLWKFGPPHMRWLSTICYLVSCFCFCAKSIRESFVLRPLNSIGRYAYSLYLFHMAYMLILYKGDLITNSTIPNTLVLLLFSPLLYLFCRFTENTADRFGNKLKSKVMH